MSHKMSSVAKSSITAYQSSKDSHKAILNVTLAMMILSIPEVAFAQTAVPAAATNFFCFIAQYFKAIVGTAALVAITMWAIEHIFGASKLHDVVIKVGVSAAIVIGGSALITNSGLASSCVI